MEIFWLHDDQRSAYSSVDSLGRAFFGLAEEIEKWLADHKILWSYLDESGYLIDDYGSPVEYREMTHLIIEDSEDAVLYKLTWM